MLTGLRSARVHSLGEQVAVRYQAGRKIKRGGKKQSQVINKNLVTRIYRWTAILGSKCVIVGNGDSKGFSHDGWVRMGLTDLVV